MTSDLRGKMQRMCGLLDRIEELSKEHVVPLSFQAVGSEELLTRRVPNGVSEFRKLAYEDGWMMLDFDWPAWEEGREIAGAPERIAQCDLKTIRKLITALVRSDRFCEGALASYWRNGTIHAILTRIATLAEEG